MGKERKIAVLGIGNPLLGDDGFGVAVVNAFKSTFGEPPDVELIDGGSLGIYLLPYLEGKTHIIVVDAINFGGKPGEIIKLDAEKIPATINMKVSEHQITFNEVLALMNLLEIKPEKIVFIGVQPGRNGWGDDMSPEVKSAIESVLNEIKQQIELWRKEI